MGNQEKIDFSRWTESVGRFIEIYRRSGAYGGLSTRINVQDWNIVMVLQHDITMVLVLDDKWIPFSEYCYLDPWR